MIKKISVISLLLCCFSATTMLAAEPTSSLTNKGTITYQFADWPTPPTDPEIPGKEVEPEGEIIKTDGPLRLDFVPLLNFGRQVLSREDRLYTVNAQSFKDGTSPRANYVQVTDNRGTLEGWQLSVRQETQFLANSDGKSELSGAVLSFDKQWANSTMSLDIRPEIVKDAITINEIGASYPIAVAKKGNGAGTWTISFGASADEPRQPNTLIPLLDKTGKPVINPITGEQAIYKNQAISLFVPGKTEKVTGKYRTVLTWVISELT